MSLHVCPECMISRVNPDVNYGFWVGMMCHCRSTDCNKYTTLGDDDSGGVCECARAGGCGDFLYLILNFALNIKVL